MGDEEFQIGSGNWSRNRSRCSSPSSSTTYGLMDVAKPSVVVTDAAVSPPYNTYIALFQDSHKHPNLQTTGLGLSSQPTDWNQSLLHGVVEKSDENSFRTLLHQDRDLSSNTTSYQQEQWPIPQKMIVYSSADSQGPEFASLNQHHFHHNNSTNFHQDSSSLPYQLGYGINQQQQQSTVVPFDNRSTINSYNSYSTFGINSSSSSDHDHQPLILQWQSNKPQNHLHFSNNAPFWNASATAPIINHDVRSNFFPSLQMQSPSSTFDEKPKKSSSTTTETSNKRPRNETTSTQSPLPPKAKKEKMGDRITALQQLVSPFGKTDTASVLSEAIEYIKFLHEQVSVLTNAYMKSGAPIQQQQKCEKSEGEKQELRSRGLCLVPVSSTFPMTHETTADFWNPTFGGTFR